MGNRRNNKAAGTPKLCAAMLAALCMLICAACGNADASAPQSAAASAPAQEGISALGLRISEFMVKNRATLMDEYGAFPDWIELENISDADISLSGVSLADGEGKDGWRFPNVTLCAGERLVVYAADAPEEAAEALYTGFALSKDEEIILRAADGTIIDEAACTVDKADTALYRDADGQWQTTLFATPGYENSPAGYDARQAALKCASPIAIYEAVVYAVTDTGAASSEADALTLKNISEETLSLEGFYLSDDEKNLMLWALPDITLAPGKSVTVRCTGADGGGELDAPFALAADKERVFLSNAAGEVIDYALLHDIPYGGSMGRVDGEGGWFYFARPRAADAKAAYARRISDMPAAPGADGVYDGVERLVVELEGEGKIYYTLDGSLPTEESEEYTAPIELDATTVIRAIAVQPGALPSRAITLSYIINEGHSLPVVSLVADDVREFGLMYNNRKKDIELPGNLAYYSQELTFSIPCGVDMHGETSLALKKKNMGLRFRAAYGDSRLKADIFGGGIAEFSSLLLRAGQDQGNTLIRNELLENLCLEFSDAVPTQRSQYCAVYINGEYAGIYALMEKVDKYHYADLMDVSEDSVTVTKAWAIPGTEYYESVLRFAEENDLRTAEAYARFEERVDIDSLIDWMIIEGYSANTDLATSNLRYACSTEGDGKWRFMLYDLDATLTAPASIFANVLKPSSTQSAAFITPLLQNAAFRERFLTRAAEVLSTTLSNENVDAEILRLTGQIEPEVARDLEFTGNMGYAQWQINVQQLRDAITARDWRGRCIAAICELMHLSAEERAQYFPE